MAARELWVSWEVTGRKLSASNCCDLENLTCSSDSHVVFDYIQCLHLDSILRNYGVFFNFYLD